ncbi:hypothetical protein D9758_002978 [Tetrapyrgos nigripes]|uniref:Karyogamy protein 5 n=1 Tax=Tetrapyrgos nigripes TaxID=182062 RepID=A0A8H5GQK0_9AGAR|nr:hypothetical protein D9758_002978 [Tetrapyrgos nigripes]
MRPSCIFFILAMFKTAFGNEVDLQNSLAEMQMISLRKIDDFSRRSDCFRKAAAIIRMQCSELDMSEAERVRAAISMTLCELATAKYHSPPMECFPFSLDHPPQDPDTPKSSNYHEAQGECVSALSRSAQFWSSYSGYLREIRTTPSPYCPPVPVSFVPQPSSLIEACIDLAKDIYLNITQEQASLVHLLLEKEQIQIGQLNIWKTNLQVSRQARHCKAVNKIETISQDMTDLAVHLSHLSSDIDMTYKAGEDRLQKQSEETMEKLTEVFGDLRQQFQQQEYNYVDRMDSTIAELSQKHLASFQDLLPSIEDDLHSRLDRLFLLTRQQQQLSLDTMTAAQDHWLSLRDEYMLMHESIIHLSQYAAQTTLELDLSRKHIRDIHLAHSELLSTAGILNRTVIGFLDTTKEEFDKLNDSVGALKEGLGVVSTVYRYDGLFGMDTERWWAKWWRDGLVWLLAFVVKGEPSTLMSLNDSSGFKAFEILASSSYSSLQELSSSISSSAQYHLSLAIVMIKKIRFQHTAGVLLALELKLAFLRSLHNRYANTNMNTQHNRNHIRSYTNSKQKFQTHPVHTFLSLIFLRFQAL